MDTPLPPDEVIRVLDSMSFFQKRALKKAGFRWDGLRRLAGTGYGARLVEAVLACHTDLLGREPRADEPEKAKAAHRHPGVPGPQKSSFNAPPDRSASHGPLIRPLLDPEMMRVVRGRFPVAAPPQTITLLLATTVD